ncbi:helix-turn-helix transcriptional regulator [Mesorhizobium sp.]|uniref:helix-turn-helix domain-containing protein n=1 Tax=Mesorhizobium sp. TaxID=1871066 RepID=UPI000FE4E7C6|nr:helix-turn-helix transcriptional regulator [Mesorhizobium sp.]RWK53162.1 MAG: XRE family transcriptional regulator [Mesorhizobium sp.]TIP43523.1 MAG: helix-turn-helix transcriptional regulator [Mesorhizobium sp.]
MTDGPENRARAEALGAYLKSVRSGAEMSLRQVEEATGKEVSNAYLSQLESGKISKPSPNILHSLASVYGISYENLMERAGYIAPGGQRTREQKHGRAATFAIENLSEDEERELLKYLAWVRSQREKS